MRVLGVAAWLASMLTLNMLALARAEVCQAASVSVGDMISCALLTDKSVRCWGNNLTRASISTAADPNGQPLQFGSGGGQRLVSQLAVHGMYSCALLDDKSVWCWGTNWVNQFGTSDTQTIQWQPIQMQLLDNNASNGTNGTEVQRISTGCCSGHSCAATVGGGIVCWGSATALQGTPWVDKSSSLITDGPMPPGWVDLGSSQALTVLDMCVGHQHTCVLTVQQGLQCWGNTTHGELGLGSSITDTTGLTGAQLRVDLGSGRTAVQISCGVDHTCAVFDDGTLKCWGNNAQGQLGYNDTWSRWALTQEMGESLPAVYLGANRTVKQVAAGGIYTCAILDIGDLKCWGDNSQGNLGEFNCSISTWGDKPDQMGDSLPAIDLGPGRTATSVAAGWGAHTCASLDDGSVKCWGSNIWGGGELGLGNSAISGISRECIPTTAVDLGSSCGANLVVLNNRTISNDITSPSPAPVHTPSSPISVTPPESPLPAPLRSPSSPLPAPAPSASPSAAVQAASSPSSHSVSVGTIVGPVVAVVAAVALAAAGVWWWRIRKGSNSRYVAATKQQSANIVVIASDGAAGGKQMPGYHTPPASSTTTSKFDASEGSSRQTPITGALSAGLMSEGTFEDMRIPWSDITIGKVLGEGGFGTVYKAKWRSETVAVKLLHVNKTNHAAIQNLYQEALIMSRLRHPCIARVYGKPKEQKGMDHYCDKWWSMMLVCGVHEVTATQLDAPQVSEHQHQLRVELVVGCAGVVDELQHHALVMQYYPQGTLAKYMATNGYAGLELATKIHIARQIASGMRFMHERAVPILHGDLKAANILLTGPGRQVAIADFGLSQAMLAGQEAAVASGALTYSISPPEVLEDPLGPRTRAADVYAFAIVLLEIYTGKRAFGNLWPQDIRMMVTCGGRPALPADMPPRISALIQACWSQDPVTRPAFAGVTEQLTAAYEELQLAHMSDGAKTVDGTHTMTDW